MTPDLVIDGTSSKLGSRVLSETVHIIIHKSFVYNLSVYLLVHLISIPIKLHTCFMSPWEITCKDDILPPLNKYSNPSDTDNFYFPGLFHVQRHVDTS